MGKIKRAFICTVLFMICTNVFAYQISFQVIQHNSASQKVNEKSLSLEDQLFTGFFNKGYIVTNSQAVISKSLSQDETLWTKGYGEAYDGFSDYFVQIKLHFSQPEKNPVTGKMEQGIDKVDYKVTKVQSGETIADKSIEYESLDEDIYDVSSELIVDINKVIKAKA